MKRNVLFLSLFLSLGLLASAQCPITEAVDFSATDVDGKEWNLFNELESGHYVLIDFFFTDCEPCQQSVNNINNAYQYFGSNTSDVTFLSVDYGDNNSQCNSYNKRYGVKYPTISGKEGGGSQICNSFKIPAFPTIILIAPNHTIVEQNIKPGPGNQRIISVLEEYGLEQAGCPIIGNDDVCISGIKITVSPMPDEDLLKIKVITKSNTKLSFNLLNISGTKVYSIINRNFKQGETSFYLPMGSLKPGVYILVTVSESIEIYNHKVINN